MDSASDNGGQRLKAWDTNSQVWRRTPRPTGPATGQCLRPRRKVRGPALVSGQTAALGLWAALLCVWSHPEPSPGPDGWVCAWGTAGAAGHHHQDPGCTALTSSLGPAPAPLQGSRQLCTGPAPAQGTGCTITGKPRGALPGVRM